MKFYRWYFEFEYLNDPVRRKESFIAQTNAEAWLLAAAFVGRCGGTPVTGLHQTENEECFLHNHRVVVPIYFGSDDS